MPSCHCSTSSITVLWAVLECLFFTGIVLGWPWLCVTLRRDRYFLDLCNVTLEDNRVFLPIDSLNTDPLSEAEQQQQPRRRGQQRNCRPRITTTTPSPEIYNEEPFEFPLNDTQYFCDDQEEKFEIMYSIVIIVRNALILPLGIFLDYYGTTKTRLIAVLAFVMGTLVMTFSNSSFPWLVIPAFSLISLAGLVILLTNLQVANLFGCRRYTVMSSLIGAFHSSSIILLSMKETHTNRMETQTSFMFLTIGVVPILVSTIAFLPKSRIPWPLPADYGKRNWKDSAPVRRQGSQGDSRNAQLKRFRNTSCSSLYVWSVVWFSIYNLRSFTYDGNLRLMLTNYGTPKENVVDYLAGFGPHIHLVLLTVLLVSVVMISFVMLVFLHILILHISLKVANIPQVHTYTELYALLHLCALPAGPLFGILLDWKRKSTFSNDPCVQQMQNVLFAIVVTFIFALTNNILPTVPSLTFQTVGFVLQTVERVAVITCLCAFLSHVHFPIEQFGKLVGIHFVVASVTSLLRFPFHTFINTTLEGDPFYINLLLLVLLLVSCGHPINIWYHCRLGLIKESCNDVRNRNSASEHLVEDVIIPTEGTP